MPKKEYKLSFSLPMGVAVSSNGSYLDYRKLVLDFLITGITRSELRELSVRYGEGSIAFKDEIVRLCVTQHPETFFGEPWDWDNVYAGVVEYVADQILLLSGCFPGLSHKDVTDEVNAYIADERSRYDLLILTALDAYKLEDLENMDYAQWLKLCTLASSKLALLGMDPEAIVNPEGFNEKRKLAEADARAKAMAEDIAGSGSQGRKKISLESTGFSL